MAKAQPKHEDRLSIRTNPAQKQILRRAADSRHTTVSNFVLQVSLEAAEKIVHEENIIRLDSEQYAWLIQKLDEPPRELPELRRLLSEPTVWNG